jgi:hypothetical protein
MRQVARASRLAGRKRLIQTVHALPWTSPQRSVVRALERARGQAVREDTERRIARVRHAAATIRPAGPQDSSLGTLLFATAEPRCSPEVGRALRWQADYEAKAQRAKATPQFRFSTVSR